MLEKLGYRVVVAKDGGKAIDMIRKKGPKIPVLLFSGYSIDGAAREIMGRGCNGFIQKPFKLSEFSRKIRMILDTGKAQVEEEAS